MSVNTLLKISEALNVPVDYLLFGPDSRSDDYTSIVSLIETCPVTKLNHLEQIISHYIQAISEEKKVDTMNKKVDFESTFYALQMDSYFFSNYF